MQYENIQFTVAIIMGVTITWKEEVLAPHFVGEMGFFPEPQVANTHQGTWVCWFKSENQ